MTFHEQRAADLARAASRASAIESGRKTQGILSRYVSSRRSPAEGEPTTTVRWGRVVAALVGLAGVVFLALAALRR